MSYGSIPKGIQDRLYSDLCPLRWKFWFESSIYSHNLIISIQSSDRTICSWEIRNVFQQSGLNLSGKYSCQRVCLRWMEVLCGSSNPQCHSYAPYSRYSVRDILAGSTLRTEYWRKIPRFLHCHVCNLRRKSGSKRDQSRWKHELRNCTGERRMVSMVRMVSLFSGLLTRNPESEPELYESSPIERLSGLFMTIDAKSEL